jgi:thioesterase domain-containing protein
MSADQAGDLSAAKQALLEQRIRGRAVRSMEGNATGRARELIVPVQPLGSKPVLFFVHADEASLLALRHFAGPLGTDQPLLGLLPERIGRRFDRSRGIADLAVPMLETVRGAQPTGPYYLAGYSLGGLLAYEMAGRLRTAGEEVAWLGVIDVQPRNTWRRRVAQQRKRGVQDAVRILTDQYLRPELNRLLIGARLRRSKMSDEFDRRGAIALAMRYACSGHDAALDLFVTDDRAARAAGDSFGWDEIHKGVLRVHRVHGNHLSIFTEPDVLVLAELVTQSLRRAQVARELMVS